MDFYFAEPDNISEELITLDRFEQKHIIGTMRKKIGDHIAIIDGEGGYYECRIAELKPCLKIQIIRKDKKKRPTISVELAISFIKPARLELILEKGTELGVNRFHIFKSRYANYMSDNKERFDKKVRQALKQSQQYFLPQIKLYSNLGEFIKNSMAIQSRLIAVDNTFPALLSTLIKLDMKFSFKSIILAVGPEGGFSKEELDEFKSADFSFVSLGSSRLRAETAAISGFSILKSYYDQLIEGAV
jgi:16S rRNA (uracil1498-N3)-methyltransferase